MGLFSKMLRPRSSAPEAVGSGDGEPAKQESPRFALPRPAAPRLFQPQAAPTTPPLQTGGSIAANLPPPPVEAPSPSEDGGARWVVSLEDLLPLVPTQYILPGLHDEGLAVPLVERDLVREAVGERVGIPLRVLAAACPGVFAAPVGGGAGEVVRLRADRLWPRDVASAAGAAVVGGAAEGTQGTQKTTEDADGEPRGEARTVELSPEEWQALSAPPEGANVEEAVVARAEEVPAELRHALVPVVRANSGAARLPAAQQDALQVLFMTEEALDLEAVARLTAELPGTHGCAIAAHGVYAQAGTLPETWSAHLLHNWAEHFAVGAGQFGAKLLGTAAESLTFQGNAHAITLFTEPGVCVAAAHRSRGFMPGVREKLAGLTRELARGEGEQ